MLLTSRNKPIYINPAQIVALSRCTPSETDTLGANCCIHCIGQSFLVKEQFDDLYLLLSGNNLSALEDWYRGQYNKTSNVEVSQGNPAQEQLYVSGIVTTPLLPRRRRSAP